jgi:hypothetical protein
MRSLLWRQGFARLAWAAAVPLLLPVVARAQAPELKKEAVAELYRTRDKAAIGKLLAVLQERPAYGPRDKAAAQILLTLGDRDGDLYDLTEKAFLSVKANNNIAMWGQVRLARILARCDSKRAYRTFSRLLDNAPSRGLKTAIIHALPDLESEDGLKLLFAHLEGGGHYAESALDAVIRLMYPEREHHRGISHRAKRMPGPRWARMQDLAVPRLQKLLKDKTLPGDLHQRALWGENFIRLVDDAQFYAHQAHFTGITTHGAPTQKTLPAQMVSYAGQGAGFEIDLALRNDIVTGRARLREALASKDALTASAKAHLVWLQSLYGDPDAAPGGKAPAQPRPVLFRSKQTNYQLQWEPLADYLKRLDGKQLPADLSQNPGTEPLYPNHLDEYLRRAAAYVTSDNVREREHGLYCLESRFNWTFNLDADDPVPALARTLQEMRPLLERMGRGTLVEARGALLVHFGVKLEGPPGKAWLPALEKAVLSWNPTVRFNAARVLCMLLHDTNLMRHASLGHFKRARELKAHLNADQAENRGKERQPLPADLAQKYLRDLDSGDQATACRMMKLLVDHPQSTLAFLRRELRVPPTADPKRCAALIAGLNSSSFKVRSRATAELKKLGDGVVPHLRRELENVPSLEARRRLEELLRFHAQGRAGMLRALQVLETLPGPAARYFLEELAAGRTDATLTREAQGSLRRVQLYWQW